MRIAIFLSVLSLLVPSIANAYSFDQEVAVRQHCETEAEANAEVDLWRQACAKYNDTMFINRCDTGNVVAYAVCDAMLLRANPGVQVYGSPPPIGSQAWHILRGESMGRLFDPKGVVILAVILVAGAFLLRLKRTFGTDDTR
jgi:hypothetical protein